MLATHFHGYLVRILVCATTKCLLYLGFELGWRDARLDPDPI